MGRILAIDYGRKRTGIAVTDSLKIIAHSLCTISTKDVFDFITNYTNKEPLDIIVVGVAKKLNNTDSESMQYINPFILKLKNTFKNIKIEEFDERFTSKIAFQSLIDSGVSKKNRQKKELIDTVSATILLQDFLENYKNKKK